MTPSIPIHTLSGTFRLILVQDQPDHPSQSTRGHPLWDGPSWLGRFLGSLQTENSLLHELDRDRRFEGDIAPVDEDSVFAPV